jgi:hypothetical protein
MGDDWPEHRRRARIPVIVTTYDIDTTGAKKPARYLTARFFLRHSLKRPERQERRRAPLTKRSEWLARDMLACLRKNYARTSFLAASIEKISCRVKITRGDA